jgi:hypothetical protein
VGSFSIYFRVFVTHTVEDIPVSGFGVVAMLLIEGEEVEPVRSEGNSDDVPMSTR